MLAFSFNVFFRYLLVLSLASSFSISVAAHPTLPQFLVGDVDHPPGAYYFPDSFDRVYGTSEYPYYIVAEDPGESKAIQKGARHLFVGENVLCKLYRYVWRCGYMSERVG
jgi:hypothetical protein